jgi:N-acetylmuramoyl-L-alanine amidase
MKKLLLSILLILMFFIVPQKVFAANKLMSVNYDTSANMVYITTNSKDIAQLNIKPSKLLNPKRIYFDLPDTVLNIKGSKFKVLSGKDLKEIDVMQNTPNVVRIVLYLSENYDTRNFKIYNLNEGIFIALNNEICSLANYMHLSYRDNSFDKDDYFSSVSMLQQDIKYLEKPLTSNSSNSTKNEMQINQALNNSTVPISVRSVYQNADVTVEKKNFNIKSKYYLTGVSAKSNGILLSGIGSFSLEKPMILTNPGRLVFDLPCTYSKPELRSKIFKYGTDTIRIGQFEANKARVVITTQNPDNYIPIYSMDGQTVLIADKETLSHDKLTNISTNLTNVRFVKTNEQNYGMNFYFSKPVIYSVTRTNNKLTLYLFNVEQYNDRYFKSIISNTEMSDSKIYLMPKTGLRYTLPITATDEIKVYAGADSRTIKLEIKNPTKSIKSDTISDIPVINKNKNYKTDDETKIFVPKSSRKNNDKVVVLDPGHGGIDYGAIRSGINEKDINTSVSLKTAAILRSNGYKVYMTRDEDKTVSLEDRVVFAEEIKPDIFVSIHVNSSQGTSATGIETHYYHDYSIPLGKLVQNSMKKYINSPDRGLLKSKFYVINHTTMPAILVEIGFISNEGERAELVSESRQQATAKAIAEGIMNYYKEQYKK